MKTNPAGENVYYYDVEIEKADGTVRDRQGVIAASDVSAAMDYIDVLASGWKATVRACKIHTVGSEGELVLQTTVMPTRKTTPRAAEPLMTPLRYASVLTTPTFPLMKMEDT